MNTCTIQIRDEVNCRVLGLDLAARKRLVDRFKYDVPGARYLPAVRLGRWDGRVTFFQLGGSTYINLLPEVLEFLNSEGYDIELEDQRSYRTHFEFQAVAADSFSQFSWPKGHPAEGEPIVVRDHQLTVINQFLTNPQSLQEVATGVTYDRRELLADHLAPAMARRHAELFDRVSAR